MQPNNLTTNLVLTLIAGLAFTSVTAWSLAEYKLAFASKHTEAFDETLYWGGGLPLGESPVPVIDLDLSSEHRYGVGNRSYKGKVLHFPDHRGKWIVMGTFNLMVSIETSHYYTANARKIVSALIEVANEYPNTESWVVRLDTRLRKTERAAGGFDHRYCGNGGGSYCFDRFIYTAVAPGDDGMWIKPQMRWMNWFVETMKGVETEGTSDCHTCRSAGHVFVIAPDGRPYQVRYKGKEGIKRALQLLRAEYGEASPPEPIVKDIDHPVSKFLVSH